MAENPTNCSCRGDGMAIPPSYNIETEPTLVDSVEMAM
jgi:hypothetical protein